MIHLNDIKFEITDVIDMHGTIIVQARDVNFDVTTSLNFNEHHYHEMTPEEISHEIAVALKREAEAKELKKVAMASGKPDNVQLFKQMMANRTQIGITPQQLTRAFAIPIPEDKDK